MFDNIWLRGLGKYHWSYLHIINAYMLMLSSCSTNLPILSKLGEKFYLIAFFVLLVIKQVFFVSFKMETVRNIKKISNVFWKFKKF